MQSLEGRLTEGLPAVGWVGLAPQAAPDSDRSWGFVHCTAVHLADHAIRSRWRVGEANTRQGDVVTRTLRGKWDFAAATACVAVRRLAR